MNEKKAALERFRRDWRRMHEGGVKIKVTVEAADGTELYEVYPLDGRLVHYGDTVRLEWQIGSYEAS